MKEISRYSKLLIIVFLIASAFPSMGSAYMQTGLTLYVDGSKGSDTNNGSSTASAFKTIQKAVSTVQPGTTIYVRTGTYNENIVVSKTGTQSAPITLANYPGETVVINGNATIAIRNSGAIAYWVIDGFTIKSTDRYTLRLGWYGEPMTDHWTIRNNKIFGANYIMGSYHVWENNNIDGTGYPGTSGDAGISDGGDSNHNIYRSNYVHDFTNSDARGIWSQGKTHDNLIENNTVYNIYTASGLGQCIDLDGAARIEWRHTVRGNNVSRCSYVGIQLENVFDAVIENNVISGGSAGIIVINYDARVGCMVGGGNNQYGDTNGDGSCQGGNTNNIIRQNLITTPTYWGWGYGGIMNWYTGGLKIWGNTISSTGAAGNGGINFQGTLQQTQGGSIKSNIITQGNGAAICATDFASITEDNNNLVYRTSNGKPYVNGGSCNGGYSLTEYQAASGKGQNSISADPLFANASGGDFRLSSSSPAIDKGINVNTNSDIEGSARPSNVTYDLGAYEFGGTPVQTSPTATVLVTNMPTSTPTNSLTGTLLPTKTSTATGIPSNTPPPTLTPANLPTQTALPKTPTSTTAPTNAPTTGPTATKIANTPLPTTVVTNPPTQTASINLAKGKPATQSSTYNGAVASRAVDGNTNGILANNSVSHTSANTQAWWQVNLSALSQIQTINVWARTDCCAWRSTDVYVLVSDVPFTSTNLDTTRSQTGVSSYFIAGRVGKPTTVNINRTGQYVRVQLTGRDYLSLAEVEVFGTISTVKSVINPTNVPTSTKIPSTTVPTLVPTTIPPTSIPTTVPTTVIPTLTLFPTIAPSSVPAATQTSEPTLLPSLIPTEIPSDVLISNLAIGKTATQSGDFEGATADRAVDGNTDGILANNSVSHTLATTQAWWEVDLGSSSPIQSINVWTRKDCCQWRSTDVYVLVSDNPILSPELDIARSQEGVSSYFIAGRVGSPTTVDISRTGRFIRVQLTIRDYLSLAEVEVMGGSGVVLPAPVLQKMITIPEVVIPEEPTLVPENTEVPILPTDIVMPTSTIIPTNPTEIPTLIPTVVQ